MSNFIDSLDLKGMVIIEDLKTNKIIIKKHNMILKSAKHLLFSKLLSAINSNSIIATDNIIMTDTNNITLKSIKIGWSDNDVKYTDNDPSIIKGSNITNPDSGSNYNYFVTEKNIENTANEKILEIGYGELGSDYFMMKFNANITYDDFEIDPTVGIENVLINTLGITMTNNELFSRIKFDPIVITPDSDLKLTYYVYF